MFQVNDAQYRDAYFYTYGYLTERIKILRGYELDPECMMIDAACVDCLISECEKLLEVLTDKLAVEAVSYAS